MHLLSQKTAQSKIQKDNDELIEKNIRLRKSYADIVHRLNTVKESYEPEKLEKLKEFELFCKEIMEKKSKLLEELTQIEKAISDKKELYYAVVEKQDQLEEKVYHIDESYRKLEVREAFVMDLEKKWQEKNS